LRDFTRYEPKEKKKKKKKEKRIEMEVQTNFVRRYLG
jgi:hypothetical protein